MSFLITIIYRRYTSVKDYLGYQGKVCVITGCASGMGLAAAERLIDLGAEVYGMDIKDCKLPMKKFIKTDLGDKAFRHTL